MSAEPSLQRRFIRRTDLAPNEYHKRFKQVDDDIIAAITSVEADMVTPLMSKIYLRLINAPSTYWERTGVLRIEAEIRDGERIKAWAVLCKMLRVSSATLNKALTWMHDQGIIGYFSGKNGIGLRIFFNRAISSIGTRAQAQQKKILPFARVSSSKKAASSDETAFKETYRYLENSDLEKDSRAPDGVAENIYSAESPQNSDRENSTATSQTGSSDGREQQNPRSSVSNLSVEEVARQVGILLVPTIKTAAAQAAAREHDRTREWLEKRGLPKVARVAQREAYNVLKQSGSANVSNRRARSELMVGSHNTQNPGPRPLSPIEIEETAEICLWMIESRSQSIDVTLGEISVESGGYLLAQDALKVRELVQSALSKQIPESESLPVGRVLAQESR
jgi:DNA-binding transcriptional regulator YhcF (GntR family)